MPIFDFNYHELLLSEIVLTSSVRFLFLVYRTHLSRYEVGKNLKL